MLEFDYGRHIRLDFAMFAILRSFRLLMLKYGYERRIRLDFGMFGISLRNMSLVLDIAFWFFYLY